MISRFGKRLAIFMPIANRVMSAVLSIGQRKIKNESKSKNVLGLHVIQQKPHSFGVELTTNAPMVSRLMKFWPFSNCSLSNVRSAGKTSLTRGSISTIATLVAAFAVFSATPAISGWPLSKTGDIWTKHSHIWRAIEVNHKQVYVNNIDDKLRNSPIELFNDAYFVPTNIAVPISFSGTELLVNRGRAQVIDLFEEYEKSAVGSMQDTMEAGIFSSGTGSNGRELVGLGAAVPIVTNTGIYGGIDRSLNPIWRTSSYDAQTAFPDLGTQVDSTTIRPMYERILLQRSKGNKAADILIASTEHFQAFSASLVAHQRITSTGRIGRLGFPALEFAGAGFTSEVIPAAGIRSSMPANTTFGLRGDDLYLYQHPDRNMDMLFDGDGAMPINQDAIANFLVWFGQFVVGDPTYSWRLFDSNPAA